VRHFEFWQQYDAFNVIDVFLIEIPMFPLSLVKIEIRQIVKKHSRVSKFQKAAAAILNCGYLDFSTTPMCSKSK